MQLLTLTLLAVAAATAAADDAAPIAKVIEMIGENEAKVIGEGEEAQKIYTEFSEWCEDNSKDLLFEVKTGKANVEELTAIIEEETATIKELTAKIEDLGASIASAEGELKKATELREKENANFAAEEKELTTSIDMIERALEILEKELGGGASMLQLKNANSVAEALSVMIKAAAFKAADASRLTALVQSASASEEDQNDAGAPAAKAYQGSSGKIIETLQGLLEKGEAELDELRKVETAAVNNFELLKQSLETDIKNNNADMEDCKKDMAESGEKKEVAEGDLAVTSKNLAEDTKALEQLHSDCMHKAEAFEEGVKEREEELKALASAKKIIQEATKLVQTSGPVSLMQMRSSSRMQSGDAQAVKFIRRLAVQHNSPQLAQLAASMSRAMHFSAATGDDPFAKVKGLINDMIAKLEKAAEDDATQKAWCDKEMSETTEKKEDKDSEIEGLTTKIDEATSASAKLKEQVTILQAELAKLSKSQKHADEIRKKEKALYDKAHAETSKGLDGIKKALEVLTKYYAGKDSGAGEGIIGLLEVCESDFEKSLADLESTEDSAVREYEAESEENELESTEKKQDVKYKTKEYTGLDKAVAEMSADREGVQEELDAVMEYFEKIKGKCIAKPETYEEAKKRREAEIAGCKEALSILENEAALLQSGSVRHTLRGNGLLRTHAA